MVFIMEMETNACCDKFEDKLSARRPADILPWLTKQEQRPAILR
jgi:hypothetical protein